ncbi:MAG TPA: glycosyltransferase [Actinomycetota bacterium]|nr:glycosyltransferase [Actinomycetota bacterium]
MGPRWWREAQIRSVAGRNGQHSEDAPRVLIYSHDTYGLGHLRRSILVASGLVAGADPPLSVLIATGSPRAQAFELPDGCDTLKLPSVTKTPEGTYRPRTLNVPLDELVAVRSELLRSTARSFRPDLLLVDHSPVGMQGELWPLFRDMNNWSSRPTVVLGLRDITDAADAVRGEWDASGAWEALGGVYDRMLVYGDEHLPTTAQDLRLAERFPGKVKLVGYLARSIRPPTQSQNGVPTVLVTAGGGGDGHQLLSGYLSFLERLPADSRFRSIVVTGPFLSRSRQREVKARCRALGPSVEVLCFTDHFEELLSSAAGVVSMAGYNTVVEILSAGVPALLVPRRKPRMEQWLRAQRLAALDGDFITLAQTPDPSVIGRFVERVISGNSNGRPPAIRMDGLAATVDELRGLVENARQRQERPIAAGGENRVAALA